MPVITENIVDAIAKQLKSNDFVRMAMSEQDYLSTVNHIPFKAEYHESEIITMGASSYVHEYLVANLIFNLKTLLLPYDNFDVLGSNLGIHIPHFEGGYYLPDVVAVKGLPEFIPDSNSFITNPHIIIEVLSPSTVNFDLGEKLPAYKHLTSLQQIIFVSQKKMYVQSYVRSESPNIWLSQDFDKEYDAININNTSLILKDIYKKVKF